MQSNTSDLLDDLLRVKFELESFFLGGEFSVYEDGRLVGKVRSGDCTAEIIYGKLILSCWNDEWARSWRIVDLVSSGEFLRFQCTKRMGARPCAVELSRERMATALNQSRRDHLNILTTIIENNLPGIKIDKSTVARIDRKSISGSYARLVLRNRSREAFKTAAGIGVNSFESQQTIDGVISHGLIWLEALRESSGSAEKLMIFAPAGHTSTISTRMTALTPKGVSITLYEVDEVNQTLQVIRPFDQGDLADNLRRAALRAEWPRDINASLLGPEVESIVKQAPNTIELKRKGRHTTLSLRGLEFVCFDGRDGSIRFGIEGGRRKLEPSNRHELDDLVAKLKAQRKHCPADRNDLLYRLRPERWLESILRRNITALDPAMDPRFVYSQVPTYRGEQRTFIDLLGITRSGRLVVIELKVDEEIELPFQGLDYWLRVNWHRVRGDFQKRGYFQDITIADATPLLYLVAPVFRFHGALKLIASAISKRVPVYRYGINEGWRSGVRVLLSERVN